MPNLTITIPLTVPVSRNKSFTLNLNNYRNTHFQTLNKAKKVYRDIVWDAYISASRGYQNFDPPFRMTYTIFPKTRRRCDVANVGSILDKFTCDALVELHVMDDDDYTNIPVVIYQIGHVDRENPRCELRIESLCWTVG